MTGDAARGSTGGGRSPFPRGVLSSPTGPTGGAARARADPAAPVPLIGPRGVESTPATAPPVRLLDAQPTDPTSPWLGWEARAGFDLPARPWDLSARRWVCTGVIDAPAVAESALTALTRGVGLAIVVDLAGASRHRFLEDLEKLGPSRPPPSPTGLTSTQEQLLRLLAGGSTVTDAAATLSLSRRTASRHLAEARLILGVASTNQAVVLWSEQHRSP